MTLAKVVVGYIGTKCYLVRNDETGEGFIVDPGYDDGKIAEAVSRLELKPAAVLLTHGHFDHIMAVERMRELYPGITVYIGENETDIIGDPALNCSKAIVRRENAAHADRTVSDNETLDIAGIHIETLFTPGHTKGGVCYYIKDEKLLFSGDTLFAGSVGRTDFPTGNGQVLLESIRTKLAVLPDDTAVYPGHGDATSIGAEKTDNPFLNGLYQ